MQIAQAYEAGGAACLSVLTDAKYFQGSFEYLQKIRAAGVSTPLLCKEFIVEAYQLFKARASGADAVLLIAAVLPNADLAYLVKAATKCKLQVLVEVHSVPGAALTLSQSLRNRFWRCMSLRLLLVTTVLLPDFDLPRLVQVACIAALSAQSLFFTMPIVSVWVYCVLAWAEANHLLGPAGASGRSFVYGDRRATPPHFMLLLDHPKAVLV